MLFVILYVVLFKKRIAVKIAKIVVRKDVCGRKGVCEKWCFLKKRCFLSLAKSEVCLIFLPGNFGGVSHIPNRPNTVHRVYTDCQN